MPSRSRGRVGSSLALAIAFVFVLGGCTALGSSPAPTPTSTAAASGPLLTIESRGGMCATAPCGSTITLERDGRVHIAAKPPSDLGTVPAEQLAALDALIRTTDFAVLMGHPFTGQCPTAYDGQEFVFEFGAPAGVQRLATCEVAVDLGSPLFVAVAAALGSFMALPTG